MPGGRLGGNGNMIKRAAWIFVACCIVVAVLGGMPNDPKGFMDYLDNHTKYVKQAGATAKSWVDEAVRHFGGDPDAPSQYGGDGQPSDADPSEGGPDKGKGRRGDATDADSMGAPDGAAGKHRRSK